MTSNICFSKVQDFVGGLGFKNNNTCEEYLELHKRDILKKELSKFFAPEFLNRIDDVILFNSLNKEDIHQIIDLELEKLYKRVSALGLSLKVSTEAKDYIENKGFDSEYGARPLKRAIQKYLEDAVAEEIIKSNLKEGDSIQVDFDKKKNEITLKITKPKNSKKKTKEEPEQEGE